MNIGEPKTINPQLLTLESVRTSTDSYITSLLDDRIIESSAISPHYAALWKAIAKIFRSGGKRVRPYLMMLIYQAYGGKNIESVVPVAAVQELIHQAMLIHDDIIDRDDVRYGTLNIIGQFNQAYDSLIDNKADRNHYAQSAALLAGDLLISEAHAVIARSGLPAAQIASAQGTLNAAIFNVVGGELLDVEASFRTDSSIDPLTVATYKTASYSFVMPLVIGAQLAGANAKDVTVLEDFGKNVGVAYQYRDDIIGVFGKEEVTGKSADSDLKEGKRTQLVEEFYKVASSSDRELFETYFGNAKASDSDIEVLRTLLTESGAKNKIEAYISEYRIQAHIQLEQLNISKSALSVLAGFVDQCLGRDS